MSVERLPDVAGELLAGVAQHRLLSTGQIHEAHTPAATLRWTQRLLALLHRRGLLAMAPGRGRAQHWHLTRAGLETVELTYGRQEPQPRLLTAEQATGPLTEHTLAVNEVGLAYLRAARQRGDDMGPLSWRHEVTHPIGPEPGSRTRQHIVSDALVSYLRLDGSGLRQHQRLIELDRASTPVQALVDKLRRYQRLRTYTPPARRGQPPPRPAWEASYRVLPAVQIVLAGSPRETLTRRMQILLALCAADPSLKADQELKASVCLLQDLQTHGPFAPIFWQTNDPGTPVDWLGHPAGEEHR